MRRTIMASSNERRMAWFPVHCCCQPDVLFGFLRLPEGGRHHKVMDAEGRLHDVELRLLQEATMLQKLQYERIIDAEVRPEIRAELAVYSDDRPLEFWRTVRGFREITDKRERIW